VQAYCRLLEVRILAFKGGDRGTATSRSFNFLLPPRHGVIKTVPTTSDLWRRHTGL
jgi:hypothetical protein